MHTVLAGFIATSRNIFLDKYDSSRIIIFSDWSSAALANIECDYVGTQLFGDRPGTNNNK
jgi:hypothetical protein